MYYQLQGTTRKWWWWVGPPSTTTRTTTTSANNQPITASWHFRARHNNISYQLLFQLLLFFCFFEVDRSKPNQHKAPAQNKRS
jgi:hypothetical protein